MIIDIPVDPKLKEYAMKQVGMHDFGSMAFYRAGTKERQFVGILAETIVCVLLDQPLPDGELGYDGGCDFVNYNGAQFDVKCMMRLVDVKPHYKHNYYADQIGHAADYFIFTSFNQRRGVLQICGYLSRRLILKEGIFYPAGLYHHRRDDGSSFVNRFDMYEFTQQNLREFSGLEYFKDEVNRLDKVSVGVE